MTHATTATRWCWAANRAVAAGQPPALRTSSPCCGSSPCLAGDFDPVALRPDSSSRPPASAPRRLAAARWSWAQPRRFSQRRRVSRRCYGRTGQSPRAWSSLRIGCSLRSVVRFERYRRGRGGKGAPRPPTVGVRSGHKTVQAGKDITRGARGTPELLPQTGDGPHSTIRHALPPGTRPTAPRAPPGRTRGSR